MLLATAQTWLFPAQSDWELPSILYLHRLTPPLLQPSLQYCDNERRGREPVSLEIRPTQAWLIVCAAGGGKGKPTVRTRTARQAPTRQPKMAAASSLYPRFRAMLGEPRTRLPARHRLLKVKRRQSIILPSATLMRTR